LALFLAHAAETVQTGSFRKPNSTLDAKHLLSCSSGTALPLVESSCLSSDPLWLFHNEVLCNGILIFTLVNVLDIVM